MKKYWPFIAIAIVAVIMVLILYISSQRVETPPAIPAENPNQQLANPASVNCIEKGYNHTIRTAADGSQTGYCTFPSGKECAEWAFFRGTCNDTH
ncbi:MAG: DUF333 domain-containing protein [archaeon]